jgi:hypothetical protein
MFADVIFAFYSNKIPKFIEHLGSIQIDLTIQYLSLYQVYLH